MAFRGSFGRIYRKHSHICTPLQLLDGGQVPKNIGWRIFFKLFFMIKTLEMMKGGSDQAWLQQTVEYRAALDCSYVDTRVDVGDGHCVSHKNGAESVLEFDCGHIYRRASQEPRYPGPLFIRTRCPDTSSKATLWMKTQNEGSLTPPCKL